MLSVYQFYSFNSMFIIDINKTKSILYLVFLWYPLLALPVPLAIFMLSNFTLRPQEQQQTQPSIFQYH